MEKQSYADIWGDTVDLRHLAGGMIIGVVVGLGFYLTGLAVIKANYPQLPANLSTAYALLVGIVGCLIAAAISAKLFPPKRTLKQGEFSLSDREAVLEELQIDRKREREELQSVSPEILTEMKELQLYNLFAGTDERTSGGRG